MLRLVGGRCRRDQEGITPVVSQASGPRVILIDQDEVGRVTQACQSELRDCRITGDIKLDIAVDNRVVRLYAKAGVAEEVLYSSFPTIQFRSLGVNREVDTGNVIGVVSIRRDI